MKKLTILSAIALSGLFYNTANAQIRVRLGLNFAPRVVVADAAPAYDDDANVPADYNAADDYYYLPDVNAYYSVADQCYYYFDGYEWVAAAYLPGEYYSFDWRTARHFEVRAPRPYLHNDLYMNRYHGANFNWARYNAPRGGYDRDNRFDNRDGFDNRGGFDQRMANRDNSQPDRRGGFGNRGAYGQNFDNGNRVNVQNRDNHAQQFNPNQGNQNRDRGSAQPAQNRDNRANNQDRVAQNNNRGGYNGHEMANKRMF